MYPELHGEPQTSPPAYSVQQPLKQPVVAKGQVAGLHPQSFPFNGQQSTGVSSQHVPVG